ncbi:allantoate amidohydrolase [Nakamurella aerolata]|uniref:Allantoate amidohydrolase n=1 Tax=Nakamurella aerolata TaxID=1656892 RepID=A0A849ABV5_9ACTN|nr:allantoate amidohydrolase [Nakamurella aerolata]NNG36631.1 allantoate amidohydrolase [Nakamurella aerolata]
MNQLPPNDPAGQRFAALWAEVSSVGRDRRRGGYSRHGFDDADRQLREWFTEQAGRRGLDVETDGNGNLWAWWGTPAWARNADAATALPAVVTGSHLDSVPGGGAFDGPLGVVSALLAVDELRLRRLRPARPLGIACFVEEEGGRFGLPCLGSRLLTGAVSPDAARRLQDRDGVSAADAAAAAGMDPLRWGRDEARLAGIGSFVELHVEQGRLLHSADPDAAVGVADGIVAHGRWRLTFTGEGNHAGTTVVADRRDPMIPAAATVLAARRLLADRPSAVATVGRLQVNPGGSNVIASSVDLWLDVRYGATGDTTALVDEITLLARQEADLEGCQVLERRESLSDDVVFDPGLSAVAAEQLSAPVVPTGAGHDAGILAAEIPSAMLFVRNPSGISHAPGEFAETADCLAGVQALADVLAGLIR